MPGTRGERVDNRKRDELTNEPTMSRNHDDPEPAVSDGAMNHLPPRGSRRHFSLIIFTCYVGFTV